MLKLSNLNRGSIFALLRQMKRILIILSLTLLSARVLAQSEDEFLPQVILLAMDSTEDAAKRFCEQVVTVVPEYRLALADREDIMMSKYVYDNGNFELLKFEFQFIVTDVVTEDSSVAKKRIVRVQRISCDLPTMTKIYNYIYNTAHTPDKIMALSRYDKPVSYNGKSYNSNLYSDEFKPGYWVLSFFRL